MRKHPQSSVLACLVCLCLLLCFARCACDDRLIVSELLINVIPGEFAPRLSREEIRSLAKEVVKSSKLVNMKLNRAGEGVLQVDFREIKNSKHIGPSRVILNLKYSHVHQQNSEYYFAAASSLLKGDGDNRDVYISVFQEALNLLVESWQKRDQQTSKLLGTIDKYLNGEMVSESYVLQTIHLLGVKKETKATLPLIRILLGNNARVAFASLLALTKIKDPRSLEAIFKYAERKNVKMRKQVILAVRQIGGEKAAAWLFTLSTGHADLEVQKLAKEALNAVEKRSE